MFKKKEEYNGPVDQYGRPLNVSEMPERAEDDRKLGIIFFTVLGIAAIIGLVIAFLVNYFNQNRLEIPKATLSMTEWTQGSVIITVDKSRGNVQEFSFDGGKTWQTSNQFEVFENQELVIQARNSKGKVSKSATVIVSNIDTVLPELYFIDPLYISVGSEFDPKVNVSVLDSGSGIENYEIDISKLDLATPGEYVITYFLSDLVGNEITKTRKVVVVEDGKTYQYRSRTVQKVDSKCIDDDPCPDFQYGDWSEWVEEKIIPSSELEVEMRIAPEVEETSELLSPNTES